MKFTTEQLQQMCAMAGVTMDSQARVQMPEDATQADYVKTIRNLLDMERHLQVVGRFAIGNLVYRMPGIEKGFLKAFCIDKFGHEIGNSAMNYQWTAHHWDGMPQDVGWGWTWYRRLNRFPPDVKLLYVARWKEPDKKKRITFKQMNAELLALETASQITDGNLGEDADKPDYTCPHSTEYVESRRVAQQFIKCCETGDAEALFALLQFRLLESEEDSFEEE